MSPAAVRQGREEGVTMERGFDIVPAAAIAAVLVAKIAVVLGVISVGTYHVDRLCACRRHKPTFQEALRPFHGWGPYLVFAYFRGFYPLSSLSTAHLQNRNLFYPRFSPQSLQT